MLKNRSAFYYGYVVSETSNTVRVDEGAGDIDVIIPSGSYSLSKYVDVVSVALNDALDNEYIVTVDRDSRLITISSTVIFSLKVLDIFPLNSGFPVMGFNEQVNLTGATSYTGDSASGDAYFPQYLTQDYIPFDHSKEYQDGSVKSSASGEIEVVSFGLVNRMSLNIIGITDREMVVNSPWEHNPNGVADAVRFMDYLITKGAVEFIPDRENRNVFETCILDKTSKNRLGLGYELKENFDLLGFYETQKLIFRKITEV